MTEGRLVQDIQSRGNIGYSIARLFGFGGRPKAPFAIAAFIGIPLFFCSLMAATLALEKPHKIEWQRGGHIVATWHDPTSATVAKVWLWALVPSLLLLLVGFAAVRLPFGFYIACTAGVLVAVAVIHRLDRWEAHHTQRFPNGVDLIPVSNPASDKYGAGFWEGEARKTALSLEHWTIGVAVAAAVVMAGLEIRRRYFTRRAPAVDGLPLEGVHAPDATQPTLGDPLA